jgi:hypothetical protein
MKYLELFYSEQMNEIIHQDSLAEAERQAQANAQKSTFFGYFQSSSVSDGSAFASSPLNLTVIVTMMTENENALKRCKKLSTDSKVPNNYLQIFDTLIKFIGQYTNRALQMGLQTLESYNPTKGPPKYDFYTIMQLANSTLQKLQRHLDSQVLPTVAVSLPIQLQCVKIKDDLFAELEVKVVKGFDLLLKAIIDHSKHILETERSKNDYRLKDYNPMDNAPTKACMKVCEFLHRQVNNIDACLFGRNREAFMKELGTEIYKYVANICCLHIYSAFTTALKTMVVTPAGAIKLRQDITEYKRVILRFKVMSIDDMFDTLQEIVNMLMVQPQNLEVILNELVVNRKIPREEVAQYIKIRADYKTAKLSKLGFLQDVKKIKTKGTLHANDVTIDSNYF